MIKKQAALFFIFLANILLSAHAVIPHHHHNDQICIAKSHEKNDCDDEEHACTKVAHDHQGKTNSDCCVLIQPILIPSNQDEQESKCFDSTDNHSPFSDDQAAIINAGLKTVVLSVFTHEPIPLIRFSYTDSVNSSIGLRAPPIV